MVQWRHVKNAPPGQFVRTDLDYDWQCFHHKHAAHDGQNDFLADNNRDSTKGRTERERADVSHEYLRRVGVEPQKTQPRAC